MRTVSSEVRRARSVSLLMAGLATGLMVGALAACAQAPRLPQCHGRAVPIVAPVSAPDPAAGVSHAAGT